MDKTIKKIFITLGLLLIFIIGRSIPAPGVNRTLITVSAGSVFSLLNLISGGAIEQMSIFALGIGPFINASIIIQLLSSGVIPSWTEIQKNGSKKEKKIFEYYTLCLAIILSLIQAYFIVQSLSINYGMIKDASVKGYIMLSIILTIGVGITLLIAKGIDKWGIGNGTSMIIFAGIIAGLPNTFKDVFNGFVGEGKWYLFVLYVIVYLFIICAVIYVEKAERKIPIQQASNVKLSRTKGLINYIPLKINSASVIPVIYASAVIQGPQILLSWFNFDAYTKVSKVLDMSNWYMLVVYAILILFFAFFATDLNINPKELSSNLRKNNQFIPGIKQGNDTTMYLKNVISSITWLGAILLTILALIPYIITKINSLSMMSALGGTGVIIVVGVVLDLMKAIKEDINEEKYKKIARY